MSKPPVPPPTLPEQPSFRHTSKYQRPRHLVSWWGLFIGCAIGIAVGLWLAWVQFKVVETDTFPHQLRPGDKAHYVVAIMLAYAQDSDLGLAVERLAALELGADPLQEVANIACDLSRSGYVSTSAGLRAVRAMRTFYRLQGRSGCADDVIADITPTQVIMIDVPTPTPTLPPPPSKTPTGDSATPTPSGIVIVPTTPPQREYEGSIFNTFCSTELSGIIEVYVRDFGNTEGVPGEQVRVQWEGGSSTFVSGLKPERDPGYGDFQMEVGGSYIIAMPGRSDPVASPIVADRCSTDNGDEAITSYRVAFVRVGG